MASLHAGTGDVQVVNVRNDGALPDLPDDAVVEIPACIDRAGAHVSPLAPLAPEIRGLVQAVKAYEDLAVLAAIHGDRYRGEGSSGASARRSVLDRKTAAGSAPGGKPGVFAALLQLSARGIRSLRTPSSNVADHRSTRSPSGMGRVWLYRPARMSRQSCHSGSPRRSSGSERMSLEMVT